MVKNKEFIFQPNTNKIQKKIEIDDPQFDNITGDLNLYIL